MDGSNPDLETFRQQWRAEVSARSKPTASNESPRSASVQNPKFSRKQDERSKPSSSKVIIQEEEEEAAGETVNDIYKELPDHKPRQPPIPHGNAQTSISAAESEDVEGFASKNGSQEPRSALEHYEKGVEREAQGSLGDSLNHYRKAFRMDHRVDLKYKNKHFPPSAFTQKSITSNLPDPTTTISAPGPNSQARPAQSVKDLIAGFSSLSIQPAPAEIEGIPAPPCPISGLPDEILIHILTEVAIIDVATFSRLAQVCKRLAFLVTTEESVWKRVCIGSEVGFGAMHYRWQTEVLGGPIMDDSIDFPSEEVNEVSLVEKTAVTESLLNDLYSASWHRMFRQRPRIRFNGCYISTVNYIRPGQASVNQVTWNSPVHIVTYYRYLRFFRDGTVLSLLTTTEPAEVVHYLTKDLQKIHKKGDGAHLPSAVMQHAYRGRWRLSSAADHPDLDLKDAEGDVYVETEGVGEKYIYRMEFSLRSAGKGVRNNKLVWKGFWNYNKLTDDWGEFGLRNDKAFFWSRVKSYGNGA